jgi:8-oxo-dGTP diphosphatase
MKKFGIENYISHLSIDCVIFGYNDKELKVLISEFKYGKSLWGLPGGYILKTESIDKAAARILKEKTALENIYLEQFRVFGGETRIIGSNHNALIKSELKKFDKQRFDAETTKWITSRFVCIGYYALVDINKVNPQPGEFEKRLEWRSISNIPKMTHDHSEIITYALETLRQNLDQKLIGFNLLPETFTMKEVQELYEAVYDRPFANNNFQKKILDLNVLERLEKKFTGAQNKAPYLYRFKRN